MSRKSGKSKGGKKGGKVGKDPVMGRTALLSLDGRIIEIQDDVVYQVTKGSPDTAADDIYRPLASIPLGAPSDGTYYSQVQLGNDRVVSTTYGFFADPVQYRHVALGNFVYDNRGKMIQSTITSDGFTQVSDDNLSRLFGTIFQYSQPWTSTMMYTGLQPTPIESLPPSTITADYCYNCSDGPEKGGGLAAIRAFGGGKYFFEGWQNNLFDTSLL
jgi:hypothetical protein